MVDIVSATSGRLVLKDTDGHTVFDSDEKLFQATSRVTGSVVVGPWTASFVSPTITDVDTNVQHSLANINSSCDTVVGAFYVSSTSNYGVANFGWFNASGTYLHYHDAALFPSTNRILLQEFVQFTFLASGGTLYLHEQVKLRAGVGLGIPNNRITIPAITFSYNLYVGSFV